MEKQDEEIVAMKKEIAGMLDMDPDLLLYDYKQDSEGLRLDLITISPNPHKTRFLFHSIRSQDYASALRQMHDYVARHMKDQDTYQIRWHNPATKTIEVSWFRASDIMEALNKFYHDKEVAGYKIYEVTLRPYA